MVGVELHHFQANIADVDRGARTSCNFSESLYGTTLSCMGGHV